LSHRGRGGAPSTSWQRRRSPAAGSPSAMGGPLASSFYPTSGRSVAAIYRRTLRLWKKFVRTALYCVDVTRGTFQGARTERTPVHRTEKGSLSCHTSSSCPRMAGTCFPRLPPSPLAPRPSSRINHPEEPHHDHHQARVLIWPVCVFVARGHRLRHPVSVATSTTWRR
jgi:hypothetical protein